MIVVYLLLAYVLIGCAADMWQSHKIIQASRVDPKLKLLYLLKELGIKSARDPYYQVANEHWHRKQTASTGGR